MLNEKRVKHMVKLALYESEDGQEEIKIHQQTRKQYLNRNILFSVMWMTVAYLLVAIFLYKLLCERLVEELSTMQTFFVLAAMAVVYFALLIVYAVRSGFFYEKKYKRAKRRIGAFTKALQDLEKMYEEEENRE